MKAEGGDLKPEMRKLQLSTFIPQLSAFYFLFSIFSFYSHLYATSAKNLSVRRKYKLAIINEPMAKNEGDGEIHQLRKHRDQRDEHSREINFSEQIGPLDQAVRGARQGLRKVRPGQKRSKAEDGVGLAVARHFQQQAEDHREHDHTE